MKRIKAPSGPLSLSAAYPFTGGDHWGSTVERAHVMKYKDSFHPYAATTILCWAFSYIFTRLTLPYYSALSLSFLRYLFASAALLVLALTIKMQPPRVRDLPWFVLGGFVGCFLNIVTYNIGQSTVTAATASIIIATTPVITAMLTRLFYREKLPAYKWVATAIEFSGVAILTLMRGSLSVNRGLLWLLLAALTLACYNTIQRHLTKTYSGLQVTAFCFFFGTLMLAVYAPGAVRDFAAAPHVQRLYVAIMGLLSSGVAYVTWAVAFAKAPQMSQVSNYMFFTPFLTSILGFLLLRETLDAPTLVGGGVIITGMLLFNFGHRLHCLGSGKTNNRG